MIIEIKGIWGGKATTKEPVEHLALKVSDDKFFFSVERDQKVDTDALLDVIYDGKVILRRSYCMKCPATPSCTVPKPLRTAGGNHTVQITLTDCISNVCMYTSPIFRLVYDN